MEEKKFLKKLTLNKKEVSNLSEELSKVKVKEADAQIPSMLRSNCGPLCDTTREDNFNFF